MKLSREGLWRVFFVLAALFVVVGGPQHPQGTMVEMLGNPKWVPSHTLLLLGFISLLIGLLLYRRSVILPERTRRWAALAVIGTVLQAVEMALHTAAAVDHANLVAGSATPVLTTHLWAAVLFYPIFAVTFGGFVIAGARDRVIGSPWIAPVGILGLLAHGASAPLVVLFKVPGAGVLFPFLLLVAVWCLLAGVWPVRTAAGNAVRAA